MEENKMIGFIKSKLNKPNESTDSWDMPDTRVWTASKNIILKDKKQKRRLLPFIFWTSGLLLAFWATMLIWNKEDKIKALELQLINKTEYNKNKLLLKESSISGLQATNSQLLQQAKEAAAESQILQTQNSILNQHLQKLSSDITAKEEKFNTYLATQKLIDRNPVSAVLPIENNSENRSLVKVPLLANLVSSVSLLKTNHEWQPKIQVHNQAQNEWFSKLEANCGLGYFEFQSTKKLSIKDSGKASLSSSQSNFSLGHNIHAAYGLSKNVFLRMGLSTVSVSNDQNFNLYAKYDKSTEYKNPDGSFGNTVRILSSDDYSQNDAAISIDIPSGSNLENGDILITNYQYNQRYRWFQIPIEMEYRTGENKWQGLLSLGASWNIIHFQDYEVNVLVESKNGNIPVKNIGYTKNSSKYKKYLGIQAGIGAIYPFTRRFYLRSDVSLRYDFSFLNRDVRLGLGYKF